MAADVVVAEADERDAGVVPQRVEQVREPGVGHVTLIGAERRERAVVAQRRHHLAEPRVAQRVPAHLAQAFTYGFQGRF